MTEIAACSRVVEPKLPAGAVSITAPRAYRFWWSLTETCAGVRGDFSAVRWYVLPDAAAFEVNGKAYQSFWWAATNQIVVVERDKLAGRLIRHEMLHALTGAGHVHEYFIDKCGGVVVCGADCTAEAGDFSPPPQNAAVVRSRDLDVAVHVDPLEPSITADSGWIAATVSVRNNLNYPVWVQLDPVAPGASSSATFGYILDCSSTCGGGTEYVYVSGNRLGLNAGQTRRYVFDRQLPPGAFALRGFFNSDTTAPTTFSVAPEP